MLRRAVNISGVKIYSLIPKEDDRGWLIELFRSDGGITPAMGYVSMTKPGVVRGPHEHKHQTDVFVFAGPGLFKVYLWDNRTLSVDCGKRDVVVAGDGYPFQVVVPPGVVHAYKNISSEDGLVMNFPDRLYKGEGYKEDVDEIRYEGTDQFVVED